MIQQKKSSHLNIEHQYLQHIFFNCSVHNIYDTHFIKHKIHFLNGYGYYCLVLFVFQYFASNTTLAFKKSALSVSNEDI